MVALSRIHERAKCYSDSASKLLLGIRLVNAVSLPMSSPGGAPDFNPVTRVPAEIPDAWRELVTSRDVALVERVSQVVLRRTGHLPAPGAVMEFLAALVHPSHLEIERTSESHPGMRGPSIYPPPRRRVEE